MKPFPSSLACAALLLSLLPSAKAQVSFVFNFTDAANVGFNANGQVGTDRRAGLQQAAGYLSSILGFSYTANIILDVNGSETENSTLASASSNFNTPFTANGFNARGDVMTKILGGADPDASQADGKVNWNFQDFAWESLNDFQAGEMDLISTGIHELTHALGFASTINPNGSSGYSAAPGTASEWSPFDKYIADPTNNAIISNGGVLDGARWNAASVGGSGPAGNGLRFNGPNAMAAAGGAVYLYSPAAYDSGSSTSHLDTNYYTGTNGTMLNMLNHNSSVTSGLDIRTFNGIEIGMLRDIGYLNAVPAPSGLAVALIGMVPAVSLVMRRRYRK